MIGERVSELRASNDALGDAGELRRRIAEDGYLFFRRWLDPAPIWDLRMQILQVCQAHGWLAPGIPLADGVANVEAKCVEPEPPYLAVCKDILKLEAFERLAHLPTVMDLMGELLAEPVLVHPMKIVRLVFPRNEQFSTLPHQDFVPIQGSKATYTCWIPLGDYTQRDGVLTLLAGSQKGGVFDYHLARGLGGMALDTREIPGEWVSTDFRLGDAVVFHSLTVHKALANRSGDRLRLSVDYRYSGATQPIVEKELVPVYRLCDWDEVYTSWQSKEYQYYWQKFDLNFAPFDWHYWEKPQAEAFEAARRGDEIARDALLRIITRDPNPDKRRAAEEALRELDAKLAARTS